MREQQLQQPFLTESAFAGAKTGTLEKKKELEVKKCSYTQQFHKQEQPNEQALQYTEWITQRRRRKLGLMNHIKSI